MENLNYYSVVVQEQDQQAGASVARCMPKGMPHGTHFEEFRVMGRLRVSAKEWAERDDSSCGPLPSGLHAPMKEATGQFARTFKRSRKGNLWRRYRDRTLVVFQQDDSFRWGQFDANERAEYSQEEFTSEADALEDLRQWLQDFRWDE
jgi:hypothetical protein